MTETAKLSSAETAASKQPSAIASTGSTTPTIPTPTSTPTPSTHPKITDADRNSSNTIPLALDDEQKVNLATQAYRYLLPYENNHEVRGKWSIVLLVSLFVVFAVVFSATLWAITTNTCKLQSSTFDSFITSEDMKATVENQDGIY